MLNPNAPALLQEAASRLRPVADRANALSAQAAWKAVVSGWSGGASTVYAADIKRAAVQLAGVASSLDGVAGALESGAALSATIIAQQAAAQQSNG
jgi:hypothetical protein